MGNAADLLKDIRGLIEDAKSRTFQVVNAELTLLYWHIGTRLQQECSCLSQSAPPCASQSDPGTRADVLRISCG